MPDKNLGAKTSTNIARLNPPTRSALVDYIVTEIGDGTVTIDWHPLRKAQKDDLTKSVTGTIVGYGELAGSATRVLVMRVGKRLVSIPDTLMIRFRVGREVLLGAPR